MRQDQEQQPRTVCHVSDVPTAFQHLGKFTVEKCSIFSTCSNDIDLFDPTVSPGAEHLHIVECELAPIPTTIAVVVVLLVFWFILGKLKRNN